MSSQYGREGGGPGRTSRMSEPLVASGFVIFLGGASTGAPRGARPSHVPRSPRSRTPPHVSRTGPLPLRRELARLVRLARLAAEPGRDAREKDPDSSPGPSRHCDCAQVGSKGTAARSRGSSSRAALERRKRMPPEDGSSSSGSSGAPRRDCALDLGRRRRTPAVAGRIAEAWEPSGPRCCAGAEVGRPRRAEATRAGMRRAGSAFPRTAAPPLRS